MYIQNGVTLGYTTQTLNLFNLHSFSNVGLTHCFFFLRILSINTHTRGEGRRFFKEIYSGVYPKWPNSWIHNTGFKPLLLTLIFQCVINPLFFLLRILNIFNTHTWGKGRRFLKKLTVVYIQKGLTLEYTAQALNLFN